MKLKPIVLAVQQALAYIGGMWQREQWYLAHAEARV